MQLSSAEDSSPPVVTCNKHEWWNPQIVPGRALLLWCENAIEHTDSVSIIRNWMRWPNTFPLPRIDDLLDQLGSAHYFSTLDLTSGYWQIRMDLSSAEKTAFITPQGVYQFQIMLFRLTNTPNVFQHFMVIVLAGLNPKDGLDFVAMYVHTCRWCHHVFTHFRSALAAFVLCDPTPSWHRPEVETQQVSFIQGEVEYLGHMITPHGLKTNTRLTSAVANFPQLQNLTELRRFLEMSSYYRRFVPNFSKIARPLQSLAHKDAQFT